MNIEVKNYISREGKHCIDLIEYETGLPPCFYLSTHITSSFEDFSQATKRTYSRHLLFIYKYFNTRGIDLPERVESGVFFNTQEINDFIKVCKSRVDTVPEIENLVSFKRFSSKKLDNMIHDAFRSAELVAASTAKIRVIRFNEYIVYLFQSFFNDRIPSVEINNRYINLISFNKSILRTIKSQQSITLDPFEKPIPDVIFLKILDVIKPTSLENPFKSSRERNFILFSILISTGIRRGAAAKIKVSDIYLESNNPRILITKNVNDKTDLRKIVGSQKTKPISVPIDNELANVLEAYIINIREKIASPLHDFLFISEKGETKGNPLTVKSIEYIFKVISNTSGFKISPHLLRHKWNEVFDGNATQLGYSQAQIEDIRKYAMGWVENSKMGLVYNKFKNAVAVNEIAKERMSFLKGTENHD